ncbi:MAG: nucleotidyltransferase family protein [Candidatus Latescibacterota bacterium]|nr:nucleotidyltransferase family protein [Candidatus Latescibacterota bacterium]
MDKAVVLARGAGRRMRREDPEVRLNSDQSRVADSGVKAMVPIERPFLDYVLTAVADVGFREVCLVIGPEHDQMRQHYSKAQIQSRLRIRFAVQREARGTADAVASAADFASDDPFLVINSDNYYPAEALAALRALEGPGLIAFERDALIAGSNIPSDRIRNFAVVDADADGRVRRIVEKPSHEQIAAMPEPLGVSMNCWRFDPSIFPACAAIMPSPRGELEITDAVQHAIDVGGTRFQAVFRRDSVLDLTSRGDVVTIAPYLERIQVRL